MKIKNVFFTVLAAAVLTACGGGTDGGATNTATLAGTAAVGAPLSGAVLSLKDAAGTTRQTTANDRGAFVFSNLNGLIAPVMLQATGSAGGRQHTLHSIAEKLPADAQSSVVANVTPLTDAVLTQVLGAAPATVFIGFKEGVINLAALNTAKTQLARALQAVYTALGQASNVDPFTAAFAADGRGLDKLLDLIAFNVDPAAPTTLNVVNKGTGESVAVALQGAVSPLPVPDAATLDTSGIQTLFADFNRLAGTSGADFTSLLDDGFLDYGYNKAEMLVDLTKEFANRNLTTSVTIDGCEGSGAGARCMVSAALFENGVAVDQFTMDVKLGADGKWRFYGNQALIDASLKPVFSMNGTSPSNGFNVNVTTEGGAIQAQWSYSNDGGATYTHTPGGTLTAVVNCSSSYLHVSGCGNFIALGDEEPATLNALIAQRKLWAKLVVTYSDTSSKEYAFRVRTPFFTADSGPAAFKAANLTVSGLGTDSVGFTGTGLNSVSITVLNGTNSNTGYTTWDDAVYVAALKGVASIAKANAVCKQGDTATVASVCDETYPAIGGRITSVLLSGRDPMGRGLWFFN